MFALTRLFAAVANLAQNVEALAGSIGEANANFRARLALDPSDPPPAQGHEPALDHEPAPGPGRRGRKSAA